MKPRQLYISGISLIEESIEFLKKHEPEEGYFLGFSGGKDSVVLHHVAEMSGVRFKAYYSSTGIDPPELVKFIKRNYPAVIFCRPKENFYKLIVKKGFPTKMARWCCDHLKKFPTKNIPLNCRLMGIRAEESHNRRKRGRISQLKKWTIYNPLFYWKEWEVWDYIDSNDLPYSKLYDEGFSRLGCVVCPFLCGPNKYNRKQIAKHKKRWPGIYRAFERAMSDLYEDREWWRQKIKSYAQTEEEFIENWYYARMKRCKPKKTQLKLF